MESPVGRAKSPAMAEIPAPASVAILPTRSHLTVQPREATAKVPLPTLPLLLRFVHKGAVE